MFTIEVKDKGVSASINALANRIGKTKPILQYVGDMVMERSKWRFSTSSGPDGKPWVPNARATLEAFLRKRSGQYAKFTSLKTKKQELAG